MSTTRGGTFFGVLDQLRAVAALAVVYSHLVGNFLAYRARTWPANDVVVGLVQKPLQFELNFGWIGVALFFVISGVVITHVATRESGAEFAAKRLLRIYPPVIVTVLLVMVLARFGVLSVGLLAPPTVAEGALAATLANWLIPGQPVSILAVGWTLVIELMFYGAVLAVRPVIRRIPVLAPVTILAMVLLVSFVTPFGMAPSYTALVPVLILGQIVYLVRSKRISVTAGMLLLVVAWCVLVVAVDRTHPQFATGGFHANTALALCAVVIALLLEGRVRPNRVLALVARRSYSLYLIHVPVGFTVLLALETSTPVPYTLSLLIALAATAVATEVMHRLVEKPSMALGARVGRRLRRPTQPAGEVGATSHEGALSGNGASDD